MSSDHDFAFCKGLNRIRDSIVLDDDSADFLNDMRLSDKEISMLFSLVSNIEITRQPVGFLMTITTRGPLRFEHEPAIGQLTISSKETMNFKENKSAQSHCGIKFTKILESLYDVNPIDLNRNKVSRYIDFPLIEIF